MTAQRKRGLSAGRLIVVVGALVILGAAIRAVDKPSSTFSGGAPAATVAGRAAQTVSGHGIANSNPMQLQGDYVVTWTATPDNAVGCYHGANLEGADGQSGFEPLVNEILNSGAPKSGATRLYGIQSGRWYVNVNSGCGWTFTFTPA